MKIRANVVKVSTFALSACMGLGISPTFAQSLNYPNSGSGTYLGSVTLLDWSGTALADGIDDGDTASFSLPGCRSGSLTATFSNVSDPIAAATYVPTDMKTWPLAGFADGYNGPGTGEALYGGGDADVEFTINWSMVIDGTSVAPDVLLIDAESTDAPPDEAITGITNGSAWSIVDSVNGTGYVVTGLGTTAVVINDTFQPSHVPLLLTEDASATTFSIEAGGREAIAFGILLPCDYGDAPGYAAASHAYSEVPNGSGGLQFGSGGLYLGSTPPDSETATQASATAEGDDSDSLGDDEDGIVIPTGVTRNQSVTIPASDISASGTGTLHAWIDFDQNGQFDADEYSSVSVSGGTAAAGGLSWSAPTDGVTGTTFARFRLTTDPSISAGAASSIASDGEVEDYQIYVGSAPVADDDTATNPNPGTPTVINVLDGDADADGTLDPATVTIAGSTGPGADLVVAGQGTWSVDTDPASATFGQITFTPLPSFTGDPTDITYTVDDNDGNTSNAATVSVDYGDLPVADDDTATNPPPGTPTVIDVLTGDTDADGTLDPATVTIVGSTGPGADLVVAGQGTWSVDTTTGEITFTPLATFTGDPTAIAYTVDDNDGNTSNEGNVTVTYGDAPVATPVTAANPNPGTPTTISPAATDADGTIDLTTVMLIDPSGNPVTTLAVPGEGTWAVDPTTGDITFTPEAGFTGDPTPVEYTVDDDDGNTSNPASASVTYGDLPVAANDTVVRDTVETVTINPLTNDSDADGTLDPTSVMLIDPDTGNPVTTLVVDGEGTFTVDSTTGEITFTPEAGFNGGPVTPVGYTVADNDGNTSNQATVSVVFGDPPVASNDTVAATAPGPVTIDPLANDNGTTPLDPASVTLTGDGAPAGSVLSADGKTLTVPGEGTWSVDPVTGLVTFTPLAAFSGTPTPAAYTVSDVEGRVSNTAVLGVSMVAGIPIAASNDGPIALDGSNGDTSTVSVLNNDTLAGNPITDPTLVTLTPVSLPTPASGSITLNADGTVTVAPGTTAGTYTLTYEICETADATNCATAQVELTIVDTGEGLVEEVEEDLVNIIEEDLANTLQQQSQQISGYSADALDHLRTRDGQGGDHSQCAAAANLAARNILFNVDSDVILPDYFKPVRYETLDRIAAILNSCPGTPFEIAGHTDSDASDAYNIDLSQRRVTAVLRALTERGVDTTGFIARGYGESQPIASNATDAGKAQNRRVEFRLLDNDDSYTGPCNDSFSLLRNLNAHADENGMTADGQFVRDQHDCITDRREVFEGSLSYLDTDQGQTQSAINLSYRREQYRGGDSVFGYFVGLYGTKSDVTRLADGEISGAGLNAGIYGANRLDRALFVDYYLGAAAGRHTFDLSFDRDIGTIDTNGDYQYFAGFAGAALSGDVTFGETTLTPRVGFDYVYTPGADVDVVAELSGLEQTGNLDLDAISGGRAFAEIRWDQRVDDGQANVWINPRVACYQSLGALDGACGFGGSIGIESMAEDSETSYAVELDGEWGDGYTQGSLTGSISRQLDVGTISGDAGVTRNGTATLGASYDIEF